MLQQHNYKNQNQCVGRKLRWNQYCSLILKLQERRMAEVREQMDDLRYEHLRKNDRNKGKKCDSNYVRKVPDWIFLRRVLGNRGESAISVRDERWILK